MKKRKQIRLKTWDYSSDGYYFVTICTQNRYSYFINTDISNMIENTWYELENKYPSVSLDYFVVMPNHIHGIISIVGAGLCVRPELNKSEKGSTQRSTPTLGDMIRWFKTITTNYYIQGIDQHGWQRFDKRLWQRNYYERIIRNEIELNTIRQYIQDNPQNWELDTNNILHD